MIFLRDLHFGFLPDDCESEFVECFAKITKDEVSKINIFKILFFAVAKSNNPFTGAKF